LQLPEGLSLLGIACDEDAILMPNKALYGLKQSARIWYYTLTSVLIEKLGFEALISESCIYINRSTGIIVCVYVDDLAIIRADENKIKAFISDIKKHFNIK
jgi:hypothetical protein